jgi:hypothetical protein
MSVTCGVNSETETVSHPMFACHHCGMPVCERHGWVVTADDAFDDGSGQRSRDASDKSTRVSHMSVSRVAMHCPKCADEFHKGADRHHGWTDTWSQPARAAAGVPGEQARVGASERT